MINLPTEPYHHDAPDRILLPWDTTELPVSVRDYLPGSSSLKRIAASS